jgi:hypothetical protein
MERHLIVLKLCLMSSLSISSCVSVNAQTAARLPGGCSFSISIQKAYELADGQIAEYTKRSEAILADVQSIRSRAQSPDMIVPGVPKGKLLSSSDIEKLHDLKQKLASISAEKDIVSNYKRDIQVIAETYRVAKLADLYEVKREHLGDVDPRKFYFEILERLRASPQPTNFRTPPSRQEDNCDPEVGLYLEEEFVGHQLGKTGVFKRLVNLISDIERLRNLYDLSRNLLTKGIADVRETPSSGDAPNSPSNIQSYVEAAKAGCH